MKKIIIFMFCMFVVMPVYAELDSTIVNETLEDMINLDTGNWDVTVYEEQAVSPGTSTAGTVTVYAKPDGRIYSKDDAGAESGAFGGGGFAAIELDNLGTTAVNTDIISDTDGTDSLGSTGIRWLKGWFDDLEVTNAIAGSITGNADTVTTITGLAPDTATTQASQPNITSVGTLTSLASGAITTTGDLTVVKTDSAIVLDETTATDTDYWIGNISDSDGVDDDKFQIGDGTTPGTNPFLTINTLGHVSINNPDGVFNLSVAGNPAADNIFQTLMFGNNGTSVPFNFSKTRGADANTHSILSDNDEILSIIARGSDGSNYRTAAEIILEIDGTPGGGADMPGAMAFLTSPEGSATPVEHMRIDNAGNVGIGTTSPGTLLTLGDAGTTSGVLSQEGSTSGIVTIQPAAAAGTWTMTWPTDDGETGEVLQTNGSGVTSWEAQGVITSLSSLWVNGPLVQTTIANQSEFVDITHFINLGEEDANSNSVGNTTNDNITIGANGGGDYMVHVQASTKMDSGTNIEILVIPKIALATPKTITDATNATPIVVTTSAAHLLKTGDFVTQSGVVGNTAANGDFYITFLSSTTYSLQTIDTTYADVAGNGAYVSDGTVDAEYPGNIAMPMSRSSSLFGRGASSGTHDFFPGDIISLCIVNRSNANEVDFTQITFGIERNEIE